MSRRSTFVTLALTGAVGFLVGTIFAGGITRSAIVAGPDTPHAGRSAGVRARPAPSATVVNFADVVDRINPAVVSIDATSKARDPHRRRHRTEAPDPPDLFQPPFDFTQPERDT